MQVYSLAKGWLYFALFFCAIIFLGAGYLFLFIAIPAFAGGQPLGKDWFLLVLSLVMLTGIVYLVAGILKGKFVIDHEKVYLVSATKVRALYFSEIKGYRLDDKYVHIEPFSTEKKKLNITRYYKGIDEIIAWLKDNYSDLDLVEKEEKQQQILNDTTYGQTPEERERKFKSAKTVSKVINGIGIAIALCVIIGSEFEKYVIAVAIAAPVIFILVLRSYKGLIRIEQKKNSPYPSVIWGLLSVVISLFIVAVGHHILSHDGVWQPSILAALAIFALLSLGNKEFRMNTVLGFLGLIVTAGIAFGYTYSSYVAVNCIYDDTEPQQYQAQVLDRRISRGKSTSYYLTLSAWGKQESNEISVSRATYESVNPSGQVYIYQYNGKLGLPWFVIATH